MPRAQRHPSTTGLLVSLSLLIGCGEEGPVGVDVTGDLDSADTSPPSILTIDLPDGRTGEAYGTELSAAGGEAPYRWSLLAGELPEGVSLVEDGSVTGVPVASGTAEFSIVVMDQNALADTTALSLEVTLTFPRPELVLDGTRVRTTGGYELFHYDLSVANWPAFAPELFEPRPDLPPCGLNTNASRTWVEIFDAAGTRRYGFCALGSPAGLNSIWFAVPTGNEQPAGAYIELWDRARDVRVRSNTVTIQPG